VEKNRSFRRIVRTIRDIFSLENDPRLELLRRMPVESVCAEIGVWKGDFSREILRRTSPKMLHLINPWKFMPEFPKRGYGGHHAKTQEAMDRVFGSVKARLRGPRTSRSTSENPKRTPRSAEAPGGLRF
jgi:hypothetical protein